jgi:hypothetical protein
MTHELIVLQKSTIVAIVDLCSFGQVFSRGLGARHVGIVMGTTSHFRLGENALGMKLGLHGLDDGWVVMGLHTHRESLNWC